MPAAAKESVTKKTGAPKAKGAVRAKSGCYTCRIRRKKCDERQNHEGNCDTCVRLHLQCLGFGAKRPEWLRESRNVIEMRDKIKLFLAAQGMIKGHAGAGTRGSEHAQPFLRLDEDSTPSSSESPPTPALTLSPIETPRHLQHESAVRDMPTPWLGMEYPQMNQMRINSPFGDSSQGSSHHDVSMYPNTIYNPNHVVASWNPRIHHGRSDAPALLSSFSDTYHASYPDDVDDMMYFNADENSGVQIPGYDLQFLGSNLKPGGNSDQLVTYYLGKVMDLQYLLADSFQIRNIISPSLTSPRSRDAARLLASIHHQRALCPSENFVALSDPHTKRQYEELLLLLDKPGSYTEDDALAAISVISSILFDGGNGQWQQCLRLSYQYAHSVFRNNDPRDVLMTCKESTRFIIKTSIWFDVLAAVTTQKEPRFLHYIRALFSPQNSGLSDPSLPPPPELSMMSVMGCENHIVWVLAEASALACWKQKQMSMGRLSIPELVLRANELDKNYLNQMPSQPDMCASSETNRARELSSNVFRAATRVYLRSIVSGDYTHVPEIMEAIEETMSFTRLPQSPKVHSSVVRSTVFAFFICGALSDKKDIQEDIYTTLSLKIEQPSSSTMGNSPVIKKLLRQMWDERRGGTRDPVPWRAVLQKANMLLV